MTTAAEYRQYAQECIESARSATVDSVRKQFLDIAKLWLMAADKVDVGVDLPDDKPGKFGADGHAPPQPSGVMTDESR